MSNKKIPYHFLDTPGRILRTVSEVVTATGEALAAVAMGLAYAAFWGALMTFGVAVWAFFNFRRHWRTFLLMAVFYYELSHRGHPLLALAAIPGTALVSKLLSIDVEVRRPSPRQQPKTGPVAVKSGDVNAHVADQGTRTDGPRVGRHAIRVRTVD